jgi:preprotein translocase subunit SecG
MTILLTVVHIIVCLFLILVVLAQQGKGQDLASAFGGGGSQTTFGARGTATLLSKVTTVAAVLFMLTSLGLTYLHPAIGQRTVVPQGAPAPVTEEPAVEQPTTPEEGAPAEQAAPSEAPSEQQQPTTPPSNESTEGQGENQEKPPSETPPPNQP